MSDVSIIRCGREFSTGAGIAARPATARSMVVSTGIDRRTGVVEKHPINSQLPELECPDFGQHGCAAAEVPRVIAAQAYDA